jgi:hypothetical protein
MLPIAIKQLSVFKGSRIITARVFEKGLLKEWSSKDGRKNGLLFALKLRDAAGDTIQGTFFDGTQAFYDGVEVNSTYTFYGGELKMAHPTYNTCTSGLEFTFSSKCQMELNVDAVEDEDDDPSTPTEPILVTIAGLDMLRKNQSICARVTEKSSLRTFTGVKGPGCVFSIDVEDASDKSIRATFFNEEAEIYYDMMNQGNTYTFAGFQVKRSSHSYDCCTSPYEIMVEKGCKITHLIGNDPMFGDDSS